MLQLLDCKSLTANVAIPVQNGRGTLCNILALSREIHRIKIEAILWYVQLLLVLGKLLLMQFITAYLESNQTLERRLDLTSIFQKAVGMKSQENNIEYRNIILKPALTKRVVNCCYNY